MILNYIWAGFFLVAFVVAVVKFVFFQDATVFPLMLNSTFDSARRGFEISLALTGVMSLWLGLMKIGERAGIITILSRIVGPFFQRLFPEVPKDHPASGSIIMNFSANILGLDNAATPLGLKAMRELQEINPDKETASNSQIMFLVLNTSGLTVIPLSIMADRVTLGSQNPTSIFIPTLIATFCSTLVGLIYISFKQKIRLFDPVVLCYILGLTSFIALAVWYFTSLPQDELQRQSTLITSVIIVSLIISFILLGLIKKIPVFETFVDGAKEGFEISIKIIPYLIAILVGIGLFDKSGALQYLIDGMKWCFALMRVNTDFVDALPVALLKPLSSASSRAMMITISTANPDSFVANLASMFRGCADTTFYILAVYFGSVNIKKTRYALAGGLIADLGGVIAAIIVGYIFFH